MQIGELAAITSTQVVTVRFYEREGLLPEPARNEGNYRIYDETHVARLSFIRRCRTLDMDLDEIRTLLRFKDQPEENCGEVNALLDDHIQHVGTRIKELRKLEAELKALRSACGETQEAMRCGILKQLSVAPIAAVAASTSHVGHVHGGPRKAVR